jgi:hypothetical protein
LKPLAITMLFAVAGLLSGCGKAPEPPTASAPLQPASTEAAPVRKDTPMLIETSEDRLPPPEVPPVEQGGVRYAQAKDGRDVGAAQVGGVLVATDIASGKQLWTLPVYANAIDKKMEADAQWLFFTAMRFDPDGRLRITNEAGKTFLVDVKARSVVPAH